MGMTIDEKIEEDLKHCSFNGVKYSDYVKEHYISKDQYEARLKADMAAMLTEIQLEILELKSYESADGQDLIMLADIGILFQQKIDKIKEMKNV